MTEPVALWDLADLFEMSEGRFFDALRQRVGMTPGDLVLRLLLRHAQGQLVDSARSVTDIAMRCGFATSQHFARRFRQYVGATPSEFRRRSRAASDDGGQVALSDRPDRLAVVSGGMMTGPGLAS